MAEILPDLDQIDALLEAGLRKEKEVKILSNNVDYFQPPAPEPNDKDKKEDRDGHR
jgi:hypothetical protein